MPRLTDLTGIRFTRLLILGRGEDAAPGRPRWRYRCDCGNEGQARSQDLVKGDSKSCGCLKADRAVETRTVHGHARPGKSTPTYAAWCCMLDRVLNPKSKTYRHYGGRGVTICERWRDYRNFLADMGEKPEGLTLERKDVNGDYEPSNCVWADWFEQANNKRDQAKWLIDGQALTQAQIIRLWGCHAKTARRRLAAIPLHSGAAPKWHRASHIKPTKETTPCHEA